MGDFWLCGCAECDSQCQDSDQTRQSDFYPTILGGSTASEANRFESGPALPTQRSKRASAHDLFRTPTSRLVRSRQDRQALLTPSSAGSLAMLSSRTQGNRTNRIGTSLILDFVRWIVPILHGGGGRHQQK